MKAKRPARPAKKSPAKASARSTVGGSRRGTAAARGEDLAAAKMAATNALAAAMPFNPNKAAEHGGRARKAPEGAHAEAADPNATASTLTESAASAKVGRGRCDELLGANPTNLPLDRVRVDSSGRG